MICTEYFPAYTHSDDPDCKNCKYRCANPMVRVAVQRRKELKEKIKENKL